MYLCSVFAAALVLVATAMPGCGRGAAKAGAVRSTVAGPIGWTRTDASGSHSIARFSSGRRTPARGVPRRQLDGRARACAERGLPERCCSSVIDEDGLGLRGRQRRRVRRHVRRRAAPARLGARRRRARAGGRARRQRRPARAAGGGAEAEPVADHRARAGATDSRSILAGMEAPPNFGRDYIVSFHQVYPRLAPRSTASRSSRFCSRAWPASTALNQRDGIHPTAEGARIVADNVWPVLRPIAEGQTS